MKIIVLLQLILLCSNQLKSLAQETFNYNFFQFLVKEEAYTAANEYLSKFSPSDSIRYCEQFLLLHTNLPTRSTPLADTIQADKTLLQNKTAALVFYNQHKSRIANYNSKNYINNNYILFYQACIAAYYQNQEEFSKLQQLHKSNDTMIQNNYVLDESWNKLTESVVAQQLNSSKKKNKYIATSLSALIPGLGKAYLGKPLQAISTFTGIALLGSQTWEAYNKGGIRSPLFIVFGGLSTLFYLGNLYGTYELNHASLNKQKQHYHEEIMAIMGPMLVE
jgi:TM2 domain-containing membrane protein YozV